MEVWNMSLKGRGSVISLPVSGAFTCPVTRTFAGSVRGSVGMANVVSRWRVKIPGLIVLFDFFFRLPQGRRCVIFILPVFNALTYVQDGIGAWAGGCGCLFERP